MLDEEPYGRDTASDSRSLRAKRGNLLCIINAIDSHPGINPRAI